MIPCACDGRAHVVCRPLSRPFPRVTLPRYRAGDPVTWAAQEVRKLGPVPATFRYAPPSKAANDLASDLECACKGTRHKVCLPTKKWDAWAKAVRALLATLEVKP